MRHGCQLFFRSCSCITGCYSRAWLTRENSWSHMRCMRPRVANLSCTRVYLKATVALSHTCTYEATRGIGRLRIPSRLICTLWNLHKVAIKGQLVAPFVSVTKLIKRVSCYTHTHCHYTELVLASKSAAISLYSWSGSSLTFFIFCSTRNRQMIRGQFNDITHYNSACCEGGNPTLLSDGNEVRVVAGEAARAHQTTDTIRPNKYTAHSLFHREK